MINEPTAGRTALCPFKPGTEKSSRDEREQLDDQQEEDLRLHLTGTNYQYVMDQLHRQRRE